MGSNWLQLFVIHLYWCQGLLIQIWSKNIHWLRNARSWKLHFYIFPIFYYIKGQKKRCFNFQVLAFQGQWRFFDQIWMRTPWYQYKWMTKRWSLLLPIIHHFKSFQKWHLCTVSLLVYEYICISVYFEMITRTEFQCRILKENY